MAIVLPATRAVSLVVGDALLAELERSDSVESRQKCKAFGTIRHG